MSDVHDTRHLNRLCYRLQNILEKCNLKVGDRIEVTSFTYNGRFIQSKVVTVAGVYKRHVLLDFGGYKESRLIADICLDCGTDEYYKKL